MTVGNLRELIKDLADNVLIMLSPTGITIVGVIETASDAASSVDETAKQSDPHNWGAKNWKGGARKVNAVRIVRLSDVLRDREIRMRVMRDNGISYKEIGEEFGVSIERIRQIVKKAERKLNHFVEREGYDKGESLMFFETPSIKLTCI